MTPVWLRPSLAAALALLLLTGCGGSSSSPTTSVDPSTVVTIQNETLVPVSSTICHLRGTAQNITPDKTVDLNMQWQALDANAKVIANTALDVTGIAPGETRAFEATGFLGGNGLIPCPAITTFQRNVTTVKVH